MQRHTRVGTKLFSPATLVPDLGIWHEPGRKVGRDILGRVGKMINRVVGGTEIDMKTNTVFGAEIDRPIGRDMGGDI